MLLADGFDAAVIGVVTLPESGRTVVCYSFDRAVDVCMNDWDMALDEAIEYLEYNVLGSYVGEFTPLWLHDADIELVHEIADEMSE